MLRDDFIIQTDVRRILARNNIDYSEITFGTVREVVYIQGVFKVSRLGISSKDTEEVMSRTLRSLELKIKAIPRVVDVIALLNWKKEKGQWRMTTPLG
jgi:hypothetical protein